MEGHLYNLYWLPMDIKKIRQSKKIKKLFRKNIDLQKLIEFRDARDWAQFHNPKDLALAINVEAGE